MSSLMPDDSESREDAAFRALLRDYRKGMGLTQVGLASLLGKPQSYVSKYESGERQLGVLELRHICQLLGVTLAKFATDLDNRLEPDLES